MSGATIRGRAAIAGVGATRQGAHPDRTNYQLGVDALKLALDDAGMAKGDLDGILTGNQFDNSGLNALGFAKLLGVEPNITGTLDYSTAGYMTQYAATMVAAGVCDAVACVYGRNLGEQVYRDYCGGMTWDATAGFYNVAGAVAMGWTRYVERYGVGDETLGEVAVLHRQNALRHPDAAFKEPLTLEGYLAAPYTIWPFRSYDVAKITAGAAAIIVTSPERARSGPKRPVYFAGIGRKEAPRGIEIKNHLESHGLRGAARMSFAEAGLGPDAVDVLAANDANTAAVVQALEECEFCGPGEAPALIAAGELGPDGSLPVNPDGGTLSFGYLVGYLHHVELVRQLRGEAGDRQVADAEVAMYTTPGGFRDHFLTTIFTNGELDR